MTKGGKTCCQKQIFSQLIHSELKTGMYVRGGTHSNLNLLIFFLARLDFEDQYRYILFLFSKTYP